MSLLGWLGFIDKKERDPFKLTNVEWQMLKRKGVDPREIKFICQDAWKHSDNLGSFKTAMEERGFYLAQGDKRGFVVLDQNRQVYSLSRVGGIKTKDLKSRLGEPSNLLSVKATKDKIRTQNNKEINARIDSLKKRHKSEMEPLQERKSQLVRSQRGERRELADQQRVKRHLVAEASRERFRKGIIGLFDKVSGREKRVKLINVCL